MTGLKLKFSILEGERIMGYSKIEVIISMRKLVDLQNSLGKAGVTGITVSQVLGCGVQNGTYEYEVEQKAEMSLIPKQMIMMVVEDEILDKVVELIKKELYSGHIGDGKIFVSPVSNIIRVRTGEEGLEALK